MCDDNNQGSRSSVHATKCSNVIIHSTQCYQTTLYNTARADTIHVSVRATLVS